MIRHLDPSAEAFLGQLERIQARIAKAQRQISSGKRMDVASDTPDDIGAVLQLRAEIGRNEQVRLNLVRAQSEAATADGVLARAIQLMTSAATLAVEGAGAMASDERRRLLAGQVRGLQEQMVALSQTMSEGRYLFGGDQDGTPPYRLDLSVAGTGVEQLQTSGATRVVEHPSGTTFNVRKTAQQIFDDRDGAGAVTSSNVFAALQSLRVALEAGDAAATATALAAVRDASAHLNTQEAFYGGAENRIASALEDAARIGLRLRSALSDLEDTDMTSAILEFNQAQLNERAALSARAQMTRTSLFDFLK
ncbi:MAG: flagellin [Bryobacteraceae bacterium]